MNRRNVLSIMAGSAITPLVGRTKQKSLLVELPPAIFAIAHQDDETLAMSVAIAEHVAAGQQVHVLWLTDGSKTGVRNVLNGNGISSWWGVQHVPSEEGYSLLSENDISLARFSEGQAAVRCLSAGLSGTLTIHKGDVVDGTLTSSVAMSIILSLCDEIAPNAPVRIKSHTWIPQLDSHSDHIAVGTAVKNLKIMDPIRFGDVRYYILPRYWKDPDLTLVSENLDLPTNTDISNRCRNAARCYGNWNPELGSFAIGMHSVSSYFYPILNNPQCMFHS